MAIRVDHLTGDGTIKVISRIDGALKYDEETYSTYLKTNDESVLDFEDGQEPTRFVLRKTISFKTSQKFKANQVRMEKGGEIYFNTGVTAEEVRYALCDIETPPTDGTPLRFVGVKVDAGKGSIQIASDETMNLLSQLGVLDDLYTARRNYIENGGASVKKSLSPSSNSSSPTMHG